MEDGRGTRRRVVTGKTRTDGRLVPVVLEATRDHYVAAFRAGVDEAVLFDPIEVRKMIRNLIDLEAIILQGVTW